MRELTTVGALGVVLVTLKILGAIDWSWWWVLLPFYSGIIILVVLIIALIIIHVIDYLKKKR